VDGIEGEAPIRSDINGGKVISKPGAWVSLLIGTPERGGLTELAHLLPTLTSRCEARRRRQGPFPATAQLPVYSLRIGRVRIAYQR